MYRLARGLVAAAAGCSALLTSAQIHASTPSNTDVWAPGDPGRPGGSAVSATWSGPSLIGNPDPLGPPAPTCNSGTPASNGCDRTSLTLHASSGYTTNHVIILTATVTDHDSSTAFDVAILDSSNTVRAQQLGVHSPYSVTASDLQPGTYVVEVDGDVGDALDTGYSGSIAVSDALRPSGSGPGVVSANPGQPVTVGTIGNEPVIVTAPDGTLYISALQHLYRSTDGGNNWTALAGPPEAQINLNTDSSLAVDPGGRLYFTFDYPYAGTTAVCYSDDKGDNFTCNPAVLAGGTDRMWVTAPSTSLAYETTNQGLEQTIFFTSTDRGLVWSPTTTTNQALQPQTGPLLVMPSGHVLQPLNAGNLDVYIWTPATPASAPALRASPLPGASALPSIASTRDGSVYVASETTSPVGGRQVTVARTTDEGATFTQLPPIAQTSTGTAAFSTVAAGADGHVGVLYYYSSAIAGSSNGVPSTATWSAMWAETFNAEAPNPTWQVIDLEDKVHTGPMCFAAGCMGDGRWSGDFISALIDAHGTPRLAWMRDLDTSGTKTQLRYETIPAPGPQTPEVTVPGALIGAGGLVVLFRVSAGRRRARRPRRRG